MTNPEETPAEIIARYEAGAVRVPTPEGSAGELWWQLLNSPVEDRLGTLRRCIEPGWVSPNGVAYLASVLELPAGASWDDVTAAVRALKVASEQDSEEARDGQR